MTSKDLKARFVIPSPQPNLTFQVCGDVRADRLVVLCDCGKLRDAVRPCGYREPA